MFSRYDVYTTVQSIYCYTGTSVLRNKMHIRDAAFLKEAESELTVVKQLALLEQPIQGHFTKSHLFKIHRFIFEDIYPFAGHIRRESISKGDTMFYPPASIDSELNKVFLKIKEEKMIEETDRTQQIANLSYVMSALNIIHPFREGNGRTIREFIRCMALQYGITLNWGNVDKDAMLAAAVDSVDNDYAFKDILIKCIDNQAVDKRS